MRRPTTLALFLLLTGLGAATAAPPASSDSARTAWERIVLDDDFPGAYQVEVADVDGDGRLDVVALGGNTCAWYQNPSWKKRTITTGDDAPGVISSATADLDGDGKAEVAIAYDFEMNQPKRGRLLLAKQGAGLDDPWALLPVEEIGSIHRLRWGDLGADGKLDLLVAPIFGPAAAPPAYDDPARLIAYVNIDLHDASRWRKRALANRRVTHAIEFLPSFADIERPVLLAADNAGITRIGPLSADPDSEPPATELVPGGEGPPPKRGASEIHQGRFRDGRLFLATIEPWHGTEVVVWSQAEAGAGAFSVRTVLDDTLADGHALWVVDLDGDDQDEVLSGHRGKNHGVRLFEFDPDAKSWRGSIVDVEIAAQDLRGGDLDGDGRPDVVAVGGSTRNVVWYRSIPIRPGE